MGQAAENTAACRSMGQGGMAAQQHGNAHGERHQGLEQTFHGVFSVRAEIDGEQTESVLTQGRNPITVAGQRRSCDRPRKPQANSAPHFPHVARAKPRTRLYPLWR